MSEPLAIVLITYHDGFLKIAEMKDGTGDRYQKLAARVWLSPEDLKLLGTNDGGSVELRNDTGSIVVQAKSDPTNKPGLGYMPFSLYSLTLTGYDAGTGLPNFKRIRVTVSPSDRDITPISELKGKRFGQKRAP